MSDRAEEGEISETGFQFENLSESEGDDYGDDYNSEEDNCGAVSFYQDKGRGWLASLFSEHQTRMSIGPSKIIADSVLSQGWQIIARRGRFSVPELAVSVCYDGGVVLRGLHLLSLTALLNSQYSEAQVQPQVNESKQSSLLLLSADEREVEEMNSMEVVEDQGNLVVQRSVELENYSQGEELWSGLNSHEREKFSNILTRMGVRITITKSGNTSKDKMLSKFLISFSAKRK
ncbi:hypothetical protein LguiA_002466 [Lonicera macranthoides]